MKDIPYINHIIDIVEENIRKDLDAFSHAGTRYMESSKHIYKLDVGKYTINIGAFGDWGIHNDLFGKDKFFHHILDPSFSQKRRMKKLWRKIDFYDKNRYNIETRKIINKIMEEN